MTHTEVATNSSAIAALVSPAWLPALHIASDVAALVLPILGALWLALQITLKLHHLYKRRRP